MGGKRRELFQGLWKVLPSKQACGLEIHVFEGKAIFILFRAIQWENLNSLWVSFEGALKGGCSVFLIIQTIKHDFLNLKYLFLLFIICASILKMVFKRLGEPTPPHKRDVMSVTRAVGAPWLCAYRDVCTVWPGT